MSNTSDYESKLAIIRAITRGEILRPTIPMAVYHQEAEYVHKLAGPDVDLLVAAGLERYLFDDMPVRIGASREAQSIWQVARFSRETAQRRWRVEAEKARALIDETIHAMRFAFRFTPDLLAGLP